MIRATLASLLAMAPLAALAQEGPRLAFTLGAGVVAVPGYFGSDEVEAGPSFSVSDGFLRFGRVALGDEDLTDIETGLGFRGSFRYDPGRDAEDFPELAGLDPVDPAFELGGGIEYGGGWYEAFAVARLGVGGHSALAGELGMDLIARPTDRLEFRAGPRVTLGSDEYAATYFGVTEDEAAASASDGFATPFDPAGGVLSSGVEVGATYDLTDRWGLAATARYDILQRDAAESPITAEDEQVSATIELTRRFDFRF